MKTLLIFSFLVFVFTEVRAEVSYIVAPVKESAKGRLETTTGVRDKTLVYRLTRIDRGNKGSYSEYIEDFFIDGALVLRFSEINGDRMTDCKNLGAGVVSFYYRAQGLRPEKILVGKDQSSAEVYVLDEQGFYRAFTDERRINFLKTLPPMPEVWNEKRPNQALVPTATAVTPAADAPAAPAAAAAHL